MSRPRHVRGGKIVRAAVYSARLESRPHVSIEQAIRMIAAGDAVQIKTSSDRYAIKMTQDDHYEPSKSAMSPSGITAAEMQAAAQGSRRAQAKIAAWGETAVRHAQS